MPLGRYHGALERMPELADALAEAGCSNPDILIHCRGPGPHVRGCWVVDLVLGNKSMNEQEWLTCSNAEIMVDFLRMERKVSARKFRLFAIGCCRRVWHWFDNDESSRTALEVAERYADGQASEQELWNANQALGQSGSVTYQATNPNAGEGAFGAACTIAEGITNCFPVEEVQAAYQHESLEQSRLGRCIFANPFHPVTLDPAWLTPKAKTLAQAIYNNRTFERMPELADTLAEVRCSNPDILSHCRGAGPHVRGCWVVDLVLGKE